MHVDAAPTLYVPTGQSRHVDTPAGAYLPSVHAKQFEVEVAFAKRPTGHGSHKRE
jgi:hypothetical protein